MKLKSFGVSTRSIIDNWLKLIGLPHRREEYSTIEGTREEKQHNISSGLLNTITDACEITNVVQS